MAEEVKPYTHEELDALEVRQLSPDGTGRWFDRVAIPKADYLRLAATARAGLADSERLDFLLKDALVTAVDDGDHLGLFLRGNEEAPAIAIVAEITGDEGEITEDDAPWLTAEQRANLSGTAPGAFGYCDSKEVLRAAIDAAKGTNTLVAREVRA